MTRRFWLLRLASSLFGVWLVITIVFMLLRVIPGDAVQTQFIQAGLSPAQIEARRADLGLNLPIWQQYLEYWEAMLNGVLGYSLYSGQAIEDIIHQRFPVTLSLAMQAIFVSVGLGMLLGCIKALSRGISGRIASALIHLGYSVPIYWSATLIFFSFGLLQNPLARDLAPGFLLGFHSSSAIASLLSVNIREAFGSAYYKTAQSKGLTRMRIMIHHVIRPSIPPTLSVIGIQSGILLSGAVITETIFLKPGLGVTMLNAVIEQDYPVVQALSALSAILIAMISLLTDICWYLLDPRLRSEAL